MKGSFLKIVGAVAFINIVARLVGFAREVVIGYQYGTSYYADSINLALTIPNFLYMVVGGAITTAFISVYSKLKDDQKGDFISSTFSYITVVIGALTIGLILLAAPILNLLFGGISQEAFQLTLELYYWMAPSTFLLVLAMWMSGVLNVHEKFKLSSFSTLLYNSVFLLFAVGFTFLFGIYSYGLGALIGSAAMAISLLFGFKGVRKRVFRFRFKRSPELKRLWIIAIPILIGGATLQLYTIIQRVFAADLPHGSISAINYASKLTQFPQAVLMTAVTTVIYPLLSKKVGQQDYDGLAHLFHRGNRLLGLLLIPVTIFVFLYSKEIVEVVFQYGSFDGQSVALTAPYLQIFALSMFSLAANVYITRFFYANEVSYVPVIISMVCIFGVNILAVLLLMPSLGGIAIAWGTVISSIINYFLLRIMANFVLKLKLNSENISYSVRNYLFYIAVTVASWATSEFLSGFNSWIRLFIALVLFVGYVLVFMRILGIRDLLFLRKNKQNM
ncbi:murein biosynthesis integral membrane protein MurJ [Bacillus litorisediminis]|uniref:murein biosynthesis integral membrane protein MurJ n=1 Tax=Bacillus litorisediminis TaxID=2922713 RepID=UPI001FAEFC0D|nr:murein biosynthesis integral membrane protein MurJ [Bacillus litorisediminis]